MRSLYVFFTIISTLDFYSQNANTFTLTGKILDERDNGRIVLNLTEFDKIIKSRVKDGNFYFEGDIPHTTLVSIDFKGIESIPFYIEKSDIKLSLEIKIIKINFNDLKVGKTEKWVVVNIENCLTESLRREYDTFYAEIKDHPNSNDFLFNFLFEKVEKYPDNIFYLYKLWILSTSRDSLNMNQLGLIFDKLDTQNIESTAKNRYINQINKNLKD